METYKFIITQDNKELKIFEGQKNDFAPFKWLLNHQGNSINHALKFEGYKVQVINEQTGDSEFWQE
jgi:hypothetical protein